jgi:hypothetical protein
MAHFMLKKAIGDKLFLAPIPQSVKSVLDCATGTGIWAIEFGMSNSPCRRPHTNPITGEQYPAAQVSRSLSCYLVADF